MSNSGRCLKSFDGGAAVVLVAFATAASPVIREAYAEAGGGPWKQRASQTSCTLGRICKAATDAAAVVAVAR